MDYRDRNDRITHDDIIEIAYQQLDKVKHDVYKNPGSKKNAGIGDNYPDIIITDKGSTTVRFIIEVETAESLNDDEVKQWQKYAAEINASFFILVPLSSKANVLQLIKTKNINARIGTYSVVGKDLVIKYE